MTEEFTLNLERSSAAILNFNIVLQSCIEAVEALEKSIREIDRLGLFEDEGSNKCSD